MPLVINKCELFVSYVSPCLVFLLKDREAVSTEISTLKETLKNTIEKKRNRMSRITHRVINMHMNYISIPRGIALISFNCNMHVLRIRLKDTRL